MHACIHLNIIYGNKNTIYKRNFTGTPDNEIVNVRAATHRAAYKLIVLNYTKGFKWIMFIWIN